MGKECLVLNNGNIHFEENTFNYLMEIFSKKESDQRNDDEKDAYRELLQTYYTMLLIEHKVSPDLEYNLDAEILLSHKDDLINKLKGKVNLKDVKASLDNYSQKSLGISFQYSDPLMKDLLNELKTSVFKPAEVVAFHYRTIFINKENYQEHMISSLSKNGKRELTQLYILHLLQQHFNAVVFHDINDKTLFSSHDDFFTSFSKEDEEKLVKKLQGQIDDSDIFSYLNTLLLEIEFINKDVEEEVKSVILPKVFETLKPIFKSELSINCNENFYFNFSRIEQFLTDKTLSNDVRFRELLQCYFFHFYLQSHDVNLFTNIDRVSPFINRIENVLEGKISSQFYKKNIDHLSDLHPNFSEIKLKIDRTIKEKLHIESFEKEQILYIDQKLSFDENKCIQYLKNELTDNSKLELIQTYFLIQCQKMIGLNVTTPRHVKIVHSPNINNMAQYEQEILEKLKGISYKELKKSIVALNSYMIFSEPDSYQLLDKILPHICDDLNLPHDSPCYKDVILFLEKNFTFQEKVCHEYLQHPFSERGRIELVQTYFIYQYLKQFPQSIQYQEYMVNPSMEKISSYLPHITKYLKGNLDEKELDKAINIMNTFIPFYSQERQIIFDQMCIELEAKENADFNNDIVKFEFSSEDKKLINMTFDERFCKKSLNKKLTADSIRELIQTYACYLYTEHIGYTMINKNGNPIHLNNFEKAESYLEAIFDKLNGKIDDQKYDHALSIILNQSIFNENESLAFLKKVTYKFKKEFNLTKPSIFKHYL